MQVSHLRLEDLMCTSCAEIVERAIRSLPGVSECAVDFSAKQAMVQYDPQRVNLETIQKALAGAGYTAVSVGEQSDSAVT